VVDGRNEVAHFPQSPELAQWRKSTYSAYNGNCVEVADLGAGRIGVRDSKAGAGSPVLQFSRADWAGFLASVKDGLR
jgi:Domain of unknown function (DUF397)